MKGRGRPVVRVVRLMMFRLMMPTLALAMLAMQSRRAAETHALIPSRLRLRMKHSHISVCTRMLRRRKSALIRNGPTLACLVTTSR